MSNAAVTLMEAARAGLVIRLRGADLRVIGLNNLTPDDAPGWRDRIRFEKPSIIAQLGGADDPAGEMLHNLGVRALLVTDDYQARAIAAKLADAGLPLGLDVETKSNPGEAAAAEKAIAAMAARELKLRRAGKDAMISSDPALTELRATIERASKSMLYPGRGEIRLVQIYAGGETAVVFDLNAIGLDSLEPLWALTLASHNAGFDLKFLQERGIEPEIDCTLQMTGLVTGAARQSLVEASARFLGIDLSKELQTSDWSAPNLSRSQLNYAALDAVLAYHLAEVLRPQLEAERLDGAYQIQRAVLPAVARMERRGVGFDRKAHTTLSEDLKARRLELEDRFEAACGEAGRPELALDGVPSSPSAKEKLLEALLTPEELAVWPATPKGKAKSTKRADLQRAAHYAPIDVLEEIGKIDKQLSSFGPSLVNFVHYGRIHASYMVSGAKTGRASCKKPNVQQIPAKEDGKRFRKLFVAAPGHLLVGGDWAAMELRAAAHTSSDAAMAEAFAAGDDLHRLTAASFTGSAPEDVSKAERDAAKAVNFGAVYGMGPHGLVAAAWNNYRVRLELHEAKQRLDAFAAAYPQLAMWRRDHANLCRTRGYVRIGAHADEDEGRIYRFAWNAAPKPGEKDRRHFSYTQSCNLPIQGACADASMLALALIDKALPAEGISGGPVIWCHDEIVLEVREEDAERAATLLEEAMTLAFERIFPGAPITGLVSVHTGRSWEETK